MAVSARGRRAPVCHGCPLVMALLELRSLSPVRPECVGTIEVTERIRQGVRVNILPLSSFIRVSTSCVRGPFCFGHTNEKGVPDPSLTAHASPACAAKISMLGGL